MRLSGSILTLALFGLLAQAAVAGDCGCGHGGGCNCGANGGCDGGGACCDDGCNGARCELKIGKKKIKVICYGCECDQVCMPCPSDKGCTHCENICDGSCCDTGCGCECDHKPICKFHWTDWCPGGAVAYHRKKLVKYEAEKEVPDYKWEVVKFDTHGHGPAPKAAPGSEMPPVPPAPKPVSFTKKAPAGARIGQVMACTDEEIRQIEKQMQVRPVGHAAPVNYQAPTQRLPAPKARVGTGGARVAQEQLPWNLFSK